jgi:ankyrin repeat protein
LPGIVRFCLLHPWCGKLALLVAAAGISSCDSPQKQALKQLSKSGIEASGRSLVEAVRKRETALTGLLLEARVYTEHRDEHGLTPLGVSVSNRDVSTTLMLLNSGANVNATLGKKSSVLGIAARQDDAATVETLLAAGARPDGLMPDGEKILPWAIREGRAQLVEIMMKAGADPHLRDMKGNPLLHIAMESGQRELTHSLIELGADPATTNARGETTLQIALRRGWLDAVPKLAAAGADPNAPCPDGRTLLDQAMAAGDKEKAALFLKIGADPKHPGSGSAADSPLERAFADDSTDWLELFLRHQSTPPNGSWDAWLWRTFEKRDLAKARLLLAMGASRAAGNSGRNNAGLTLTEAAASAVQMDFLKLWLDYGFPAGRSLEIACQRGDHLTAELLLAAGESPERSYFPSRDTRVSRALRARQDALAATLIRAGASTDSIPPEGQSLLHLAIARKCPAAVGALLENGANPNAPFTLPVSPDFLKQVRPGVMRWILKMDRNATPLMLAADSGNVQTARQLIKAGAKINVRTKVSSLWPINFASRRSDVPMMRLFLGQDPHREDRRIEVRLKEQRALVFDAEGKEIFATKVSTGRKGYATPTGEFVITNKHRDWTSTLYHSSMPYFQRLSCGDFGLHQGNIPGYPASHGCIRLPAGVAAKLFSMTKTGDRVSIVP